MCALGAVLSGLPDLPRTLLVTLQVFTLYDAASLLTDDMADLLGSRFRGDNPLLQLCDEALQDSVLLAPQ